MINSCALANFFLSAGHKDKVEISNLKLQKLMFIGYGWVLALTDQDLTAGEGFQAWQHGPVLPSVYHQMKRFGGAPIPKNEFAIEYDSDENQLYQTTISDPQIKMILERVWTSFKDFSAWTLRNITHEKGTPWDQTYHHDSNFLPIDKKIVKTFYHQYITELIEQAS